MSINSASHTKVQIYYNQLIERPHKIPLLSVRSLLDCVRNAGTNTHRRIPVGRWLDSVTPSDQAGGLRCCVPPNYPNYPPGSSPRQAQPVQKKKKGDAPSREASLRFQSSAQCKGGSRTSGRNGERLVCDRPGCGDLEKHAVRSAGPENAVPGNGRRVNRAECRVAAGHGCPSGARS